VTLVSVDQRIPPVRGLILLQNTKRKPYAPTDLKRWIRLNRVVYKTPKIDLLALGDRFEDLSALLEYAAREDTRLSLRTDCAVPPPTLGDLKKVGLFDVFLCPPTPAAAHLDGWFEASRDADLPMRLQLQAPFAEDFDIDELATRIRNAGVVAVNVTLSDPFIERPPCRDAAESKAVVDLMNAVVAALDAHGIEANLLNLPLCLVTEENLVRAVNTPQFFMDHQQYLKTSYDLVLLLRNHGPVVMGKILTSTLWRHTVGYALADDRLLNWLVNHPAAYARMAFWRKLTKHLRITRGVPKELGPPTKRFERQAERVRRQSAKALGPTCAA